MNLKTACPGLVAKLFRASSRYAKISALIPGQGTYKDQPKNI